MSDTPAATTDHAAAAPKKKGKLMIIIIAVVVLALGGGGGWYFYSRSVAAAKEKTEKGKKEHGDEEKSEKSGKSGKSEKEDEADDEGEKHEEEGEEEETPKKSKKAKALSLPDDSEVKQVVELQPFIVNLADPGESHYLRLTVSLGLGGEGGAEEKPNPIFVTRIRNAMLAVLSTKSSEEVLTVEGKAALRKELLKAARAASKEPKVQAIYITEFIIQL